jgi:FdhE protein
MVDRENSGAWDQRVARARELATRYPAAAEILGFYVALSEYQKSLLLRSPSESPGIATGRFDDLLDREQVLAGVDPFIAWLERAAPARLAQTAVGMRGVGVEEWRQVLDARLSGDLDQVPDEFMFVIEALLQPFAERAASRSREMHRADPETTGSERLLSVGKEDCPACGDRPVVGLLREEGHGARRHLLCGLCLTEWDYLRVRCPSCGEERFEALSVYTAEQCAHVRIEACDSCRCYLKTIDATKDGLAVPVVDDLATASLDLWAREQGYVRLRSNLLKV